MSAGLYLGVDVGTGSARAGLFDASGRVAGVGRCPIRMWQPEEDFAEQSSADVWAAAGEAIGQALRSAGASPAHVRGLAFDATCSLVVLDADDRPVTVSPSGDDQRNIVVWMDHRAIAQAEHINAGDHDVLRYVGGVISPEMEMPKLLWLKQNLPRSWRRAARFFDLADFLAYRATGVETRSLCTTVCKWTYLGHEGEGGRWDDAFLARVGLGDLAQDGHARIGRRVRPLGERQGSLTEAASRELGLTPGTPVGVALIDAHAGGIGLLGTGTADEWGEPGDRFNHRLALIGGTSSCHMAVSAEPRFIEGVWGPYYSAMIPGMWLTEGGQSATGALIDHVIRSHARAPELEEEAERRGTSVHGVLEERVASLSRSAPFAAALTRDLHVFPDFHGNRSPRADPSLRGMISGLKLSATVDSLALLYLATVQAVAHGTRHIIDQLNASGYRIDTMVASGGDTKSELFVREHADVTGCRIILPREEEAVLLGGAMLAAVAAGDQPSVVHAMAQMSGTGRVVEPAGGEVAAYHERKRAVFHRMHEDQLAYRGLMAG